MKHSLAYYQSYEAKYSTCMYTMLEKYDLDGIQYEFYKYIFNKSTIKDFEGT